jgi:hypothetical protein
MLDPCCSPLWLVPSFYGDIRLERTSTGCLVITEALSALEKEALTGLSKLAVKKKWLPEGRLLGLRVSEEVAGPIDKVAKALAQALKPDRRIVSVVKFSGGVMQEIAEGEYDDKTPESLPDPYRGPKPPEPTPAALAEPVAATAVARPTRGCPAPDFESADVRATRVLRTFLTPDHHNRFIAVGAITGHRYMVTSRHARGSLAEYHRSLYDLDDEMPFCIHDWTVPSAEEALAIGLLVQLPNHEEFLRHLEA